MKKQITFLGIVLMMAAATALIAAGTQQDKDKGQKKEQQKGNDKPDKAQKDQGKNDNANQGQGKGNSGDKGQGNQGKNDNANQGQGNENKGDKGQGNQGKNDNNNGNNGNGNNKGNVDLTDGFKWDRNSFKDRDKIRKQEKVTLCHKFNNNNEPAVSISVSSNALKAHLNHGDTRGECPATNNTFSDKFLKRRTDYYNDLQAANEQVLYSQSVLDYAKMRLAQAQQALAATEASRYTMAQIQQRQATVTELEQNVSLLEVAVSAAAQLLVNKLSN